ncbi:MAG: endo alpha-1,4 polygalactosaminidase [Bacteroidetes bacterium]|nr:endo alpha-1,4 polygalactosaminidase [Bacteroidota bacterium]
MSKSGLAGILMSVFLSGCNTTTQIPAPFGVCYTKLTPENIVNYKLVVVEPDHYTKLDIDALKEGGTKMIAYVSLGEVHPTRWYFPLADSTGNLLGKNEDWGSHFLNIGSPSVRQLFLDRIIPNIMASGYDGLFFDTVDAVAPYTTRKNLQKDMADLINSIRKQNPDAILIQNAGLFLLDQTSSSINAVAIEDIASDYQFSDQSYRYANEQEFSEKIKNITDLSEKYHKQFLLIDFSDRENLTDSLQSRLNDYPFPYFIGKISLDELPVLPPDAN